MNINDPEVYQVKAQIKHLHSKGLSWDTIRSGKFNGFSNYFQEMKDVMLWDISFQDWIEIIDEVEEVTENSKSAFIGCPEVDLKPIPLMEKTSWQLYKKVLENNDFTELSIERIEKSTQKIVSQLSDSTSQDDPVRGMVVGNVQSGKTASMAGVMAMAADYGFNFFIVLTGTIDNLKRQTEERLIGDLNSSGINTFISLPALSNSTDIGYKLENLHLNDSDNLRYLYVCLKNSSRLNDLLNWINDNQNCKKNLKILILDDEADQAGVNTSNMSKELISTINREIKYLVFGKNKYGIKCSPYGCMNYIGYTATPYANFLNEADDGSLYPTNFITVLKTPEEYIGPQQIFGIEDENEGLPIINKITSDEIEIVKYGLINKITNELELSKAIAWFMCTVACFRYWDLKQPVSMLIHTSQKISDHNCLASFVERIISNLSKSNGIDFIESVYKKQSKMLTAERFLREFPEFPKKQTIKNYPDFKYLLPYIKELIRYQTKHIEMNEDGSKLEYSKGIHLCIDNCSRNKVEENIVFRVIYPDKNKNKEELDYCPAFIVVGGSTLSRGLTLKGLTTSYFVRGTEAADTLMQMGRWFGYRRGYELLPRLWLSEKAITQFEFLTVLDSDLREEITNMENMHLIPTQYGPRLDTFPNFKMLKTTANNKSQNMIIVENDYANKKGQTTKFFDDPRIIETNYNKTIDFVDSLGPVDINRINRLNNKYTNNGTFIWFNCDYAKVIDFLCSLEYPVKLNKSATFSKDNKEDVKKWFDNQYKNGYLNNFNVVVIGNDKVGNICDDFKYFKIKMPTRRRLSESVGTRYIDLKILTEPNDKLVDIDVSKLTSDEKMEFENEKGLKPTEKRIKFHMENTPLLVIYVIDKNSGENEQDTKERVRLKLTQNLVGYHVFIPYGNSGKAKQKNYDCEKATVRLDFLRGVDNENED